MLKFYYINNSILPKIIYNDILINKISDLFDINNFDIYNDNLYQIITNNKINANVLNNKVISYKYHINNNIIIPSIYELTENKKYFFILKNNKICYKFLKYHYDNNMNKIYFNDNDIKKIKINVIMFMNNINILSYFNII